MMLERYGNDSITPPSLHSGGVPNCKIPLVLSAYFFFFSFFLLILDNVRRAFDLHPLEGSPLVVVFEFYRPHRRKLLVRIDLLTAGICGIKKM